MSDDPLPKERILLIATWVFQASFEELAKAMREMPEGRERNLLRNLGHGRLEAARRSTRNGHPIIIIPGDNEWPKP